ncbi:MAG: NAD(P)-binding domain-containing protein, partial [Lachnospiraceae bacterium]|nr:NAD(P)-binding domain-containing protein [Lachnospiraceae bacterium]
MADITVFGAGSWGSALAIHLSECGHDVTLWAHRQQTIDDMSSTRMVGDKLPGVRLPDNIKLSSNVRECAPNRDLLILAVPSTAIRETAKLVWPYLAAGEIIVNASKGLED